MAQPHVSMKRIGVNKANSRMVAVTALAAFVVVFCIVASLSLFSQLRYQNGVISGKKKAVAQLQANLKARDGLVAQYKAFVSAPQNILGGNPNGTGPMDGSNAKIILDALPSRYDFPALTSSLEKVMTDQGVQIKSLNGTDDAVAQEANQSAGDPTPVPVPFEITIEGGYAQVRNAVGALERSIRPFQIDKTDITGDQNSLSVDITGETYYQPQKELKI